MFTSLESTNKTISAVSGVHSISTGVLHHGEVIYNKSFGYRDVEAQTPGNDETIYYLGSMTKGFTAEAIAILVDDGKIGWSIRVKDVFPAFQSNDKVIYKHATITDPLSHWTALERADAFWAQSNNNILLSREQALPTINQLRAVTPFRAEYRYNNWGYEVAGRIIEKLSGKTYSQFLSEKIFEPLGMTRTFNDDSECHGANDLAQAYMTFDDTSPAHVPRAHMADGTLMNPADGIQSCIKDLLKYYGALMVAGKDQFPSGKTATEGSPLKQVAALLSSNIQTAPRLREQSYACGWARVQLPGVLAETSRNQALMSSMPIMGNPDHPRLVIYHHGMLVGFNNGAYLFPESDTAIVLLSNAVALNDGPGWIGHLLMETLFNDPTKHDYIKLTTETAETARNVIPQIKAQLENERGDVGNPKTRNKYVGRYYNTVKTFFMHISEKDDELWMNLQGNKVETYRLQHYNGDEFSWLMTRIEMVKRGRNPIGYAEYWKIRFVSGDDGGVSKLYWVIEKDLPGEGMELTKDTDEVNHAEL
jgi:CubicO group peptidase (beta-lactamase class C family)